MQTEIMEHSRFAQTTESVILDQLRLGAVPAAELQKRILDRIRGLKAKQCKAVLDALVAQRQIHGKAALGPNGKPKKTVESYVLGPPPPPPPPARELAPKAVLEVLQGGAVSVASLKKQVLQRALGLAAKDYASVLEGLVSSRQIHARHKRNANGKLGATIESYALGAVPPHGFVAPVLALLETMRAEARAAGVEDEAVVNALLEALAREGIAVRPAGAVDPGDDRAGVLRGVRSLEAREGRGALIAMRKLRGELRLPKARFDAAVLQLYADGALILHHHDYVGSLSEAERDELVVDQYGNYYVGVALSGES